MTDISHLKLYYFVFEHKGGLRPTTPYTGRGENVKLFLEDAGIPHDYIMYDINEWSKYKDDWIKRGYLAGCLPAVETPDGELYGCTTALLRFLSKNLNKYYGANIKEEQLVDAISELANDWYANFDASVWTPDQKDRENHLEKNLPKHLERLDRFYAARGGPYVLGSEISFADFQVYQMVADEKLTPADLPPHLAAFVKAFEERPNIKKYRHSKRASL
ncbi:glutathione S-transferase [Zychaea mexicana]|uniref:glutathione S-transferase n=1 Tax=Zychaea mexicana TaxID=64656 RepID=UPI0022FDD1F3|nr:glutathione S-transferase [Zychaea mexicana]KAI9495912.1 glutathione S-transferase [Zychaea mexicana]